MSSNDNNPKVVDLNQRSAAATLGERPAETLGQVRTHALKRLTALATTLFENADDALFDLASKADSNAVQAEYFDGMREVRKKRQQIELRFQEQLARQFVDFMAGRQPNALKSEGGELSLSLVDNQELEESLAVASMVAKTENRLQRVLFAVNQRLSALTNQRVEDANSPVGPTAVGQAFRTASSELEMGLPVRLIIYKLFDRYVMGGLDQFYDELNALLVHAGVLPQMRSSVARRPGAPAGPAATPGTPGAPRPGTPGVPGMPQTPAEMAAEAAVGGYMPVDAAAAEMQANLYSSLRALLATRRHDTNEGPMGLPGGYVPLTYNPNVTPLNPTELLSALTILQNQALSMQSAAETAQLAIKMKEELLGQAGKLRGENGANVSSADEDTIDLVGMLFEYILQDRNLPAQMQAMLGRLQIPFLKVALLDKHLFARRTHPARVLLDSLAHACVGWSEESDRDRRLQDKVREVVESLLKDFEDDLGIFDRLRIDFEAFVEANKRRADLAEQRASEATRGREKLLEARRTAAREVMQRIESRELPDLIRNLLSRPWANYLVLVLLRQGDTSDEWRHALRFADELVWSVQPKSSAAERERLHALLPQLEKTLRHGLATVAFDENDVRKLMQQLNVVYQALLHPTDPGGVSEVPTLELTDPLPMVSQDGADNVMSAIEEEPPPLHPAEQVDEQWTNAVRELKVGTWIEFTDEQGAKERAKLSWISPISSKYLFVNRKGLKVADRTALQLASDLASARVVILEEVPLFDRALDAIVERLKSAHAAKSPAAAQQAAT
ncbi:DUF1631 domain-containing protein [Tahibacter amnicola]|uniref:DUF1631 domain-containing protein n=1 Tax=Tahibacter amnicola TaxID=2976241 RepID=A0ABY6BJ32_9GAMM|nr:DUF1631 domain-containing protein [Tahibacter amnicola]UXI69502.1 DUF1631 domain-containing protein [Tahibacter amnicola]